MAYRGKVLVAEDEYDIAFVLSKSLRDMGYKVIEAYTPEECIKKIYKEKPDVALIDGMFRDLCRQIKECSNSMAVILHSVVCSEEELKKIGADDQIHRPLNIRRVIETIDFLVSRKLKILDA